jgi:hypothetical protein
MTITRLRCLLATGVLAVLAGLAAAPPVAVHQRSHRENLSRWQWYCEVKLAATAGPGGRVDFIVTPAVFGRANLGLSDLRLVDDAGETVPYDLRIRTPRNDQEELPGIRTYNQVVNADRSVAASIDLGEAPREHNEIAVNLAGTGYGRPLRLEGSADGKSWSKLLDGVYVVHLEAPAKIDQRRFTYPPSRFRFLRVHVRPDRVIEDDEPKLESVRVYHTVHLPGESVTLPAKLEHREPGRLDGQYSSSWLIDLGARNVPCERLSLQIAEQGFARPYSLEIVESGNPTQPFQYDTLRRQSGDRPGEVAIPLRNPVEAHRLRLTIQDASNPPLTIEAVHFTAAARQVVFEVPAGLKTPLRLYSGNPDSPPPQYDFASSLPPRLDPPPVRATLSEPERNPKYVPPPKPWSERWPYLVDGVLAGACALLLTILFVLARTAIRKHDSVQPATSER